MIILSNKGKPSRSSDRRYMRNIVPLFLGMLICISCLAGVTWAWFTANSTASVQRIQSAEYSVAVEVKKVFNQELAAVTVEENVASCTLEPDTGYSVKLTPNGTATKGFCLITDGTNVYTTGPLSGEEPFEFTYNNGLQGDFSSTQDYDELIQKAPSSTLAIAWYWGEYPNTLGQTTYSMEEPIQIENGCTIGHPIAGRPEGNAALSLKLTNVTADKESGTLGANTDCVITFTAAEGYTLPTNVVVEGVESYIYKNGVLTIPADQVKDGTTIIVTVDGVAKTTEKPTTSPSAETATPPTTESEMPPDEGDSSSPDPVQSTEPTSATKPTSETDPDVPAGTDG